MSVICFHNGKEFHFHTLANFHEKMKTSDFHNDKDNYSAYCRKTEDRWLSETGYGENPAVNI